jgi:hypothetical protein
VVCSCKSEIFESLYIVKKISALQSPTGKEEIVPIQIIVCKQCGKSLEELLYGATLQ